MSVGRASLWSLAGSFILSACAGFTPSEADIAELIEVSVKGSVEALATYPPVTATPTPSQTPTPTSTLAPTASLTPTPEPLKVSVSLATNCRTGPGAAYPFVLDLQPGQVAQVMAQSTVEDYWYIADPEGSDEHCWLWGEYATVEGEAGNLPVLTPEPSPIPQSDFTMYLHSISECGSTRVVFTVLNNSARTFRSARLHVEDVTNSSNLRGPKFESHPFSYNPSSCPRDKEDSFPPGAIAYVMIPIKPFEEGNQALAHITLCTEQEAGGHCATKSAYFRLPAD
jgi:hypothetical protein